MNEDRMRVGRENRIAWLINHTTLREFEVPLIRSLGYEVWTGKQLSKDPDFGSASADFEDDEHCTLPAEALELLNGHNFYDQKLTPAVAAALNEHFGTVITIAFRQTIAGLIEHYQGRLIYRAFGREAPYNYTQLFEHYAGKGIWEQAERIRERLWMAPCYETIAGHEEAFLRERSVMLPLGLPERVFAQANRWRGGQKHVLFVCPRIASHPYYYGRIHQDFKRDFGDFPHVIGGGQPKPVDDPKVLGYLTAEQYDRLYCESQVMYYHSREPRHVHYHPVEAMVYGMPVIYMRGGILELYGAKEQPGACETVGEAREKLTRVLEGDEKFIEQVRGAQQAIVEKFTYAPAREAWVRDFVGGIMSRPAGASVCSTAA